MQDVTIKDEVRRTAVAEGFLHVRPETLEAAGHNTPKGDLETLARVVGLAWAKHLPLLLPDAHPVRLTQGEILVEPLRSDDGPARLRVRARCTGVDRTGVELEAIAMVLGGLTAAWDALKPFEKDERGQYPTTCISDVRVVSKEKAHAGHATGAPARLAVVVATDSRRGGGDQTGPLLCEAIEGAGHEAVSIARVPDDVDAITTAISAAAAAGVDVVLLAGGTGPGPRDVSPEALARLGGVELPGFGERLRHWSSQHAGINTILSRATCRLVEVNDHRLAVAALPGHPRAAASVLPYLDSLAHASHLWRGLR